MKISLDGAAVTQEIVLLEEGRIAHLEREPGSLGVKEASKY